MRISRESINSFFKKDVNKAIVSVILFLSLWGAISFALITMSLHSDHYFFNDIEYRKQISGTLDTLYCGSSHGLCAFSPQIIDPITNENSYNICGALTSLSGIKKMLETELPRNPVKTVVVEVCYNTLTRDETREGGEGEIYVIARLDGTANRLDYMLKTVEPENYTYIYSTLMKKSFVTAVSYILGTSEHEGSLCRGQHRQTECSNQLIPKEQVSFLKDTALHDEYPLERNMEKFNDVINLCRKYDVRIIFAVTPIAESSIWCVSNYDQIMQYYIDYAAENDIDYYDFNLLKDRRTYFPDDTSFYDPIHLDEVGSISFSKKYAEIINIANSGGDTSQFFYDSYEQYKTEQPYSLYYAPSADTIQPAA